MNTNDVAITADNTSKTTRCASRPARYSCTCPNNRSTPPGKESIGKTWFSDPANLNRGKTEMKNQIDLDTLLTSERKKSGNPDNESVHSIRPCFNAKRQRQLPATRIPINMLRKNDKCSATDATYPLLEAGTSLHNCLAKVAPWIHGAVFDERLADEDIEEEFAELIFITRKIEDLERQIAGVVKARTGRLEAFHV